MTTTTTTRSPYAESIIIQDKIHLLDSLWQRNSPDFASHLVGGGRRGHATVVVSLHDDEDEDDTKDGSSPAGSMVVVVGGYLTRRQFTNTILVGTHTTCTHTEDESPPAWHHGPSLANPRFQLAAVACQDLIYAIGGYDGRVELDTVERIPIAALKKKTNTTTPETTSTTSGGWSRLTARLSERRTACAAVTVHNRFLVVLGGFNGRQKLASVDVMDTQQESLVTRLGPPLTVPRIWHGAAVWNDCLWVVGGQGLHHGELDCMECLALSSSFSETNNNNASSIFASSAWTVRTDVSLATARCGHSVLAIPTHRHGHHRKGGLLVVAGGRHQLNRLSSIEVFEIQPHSSTTIAVVESFPPLTMPRFGASLVLVPDCDCSNLHHVLAVGGWTGLREEESVEVLSLLLPHSFQTLQMTRTKLERQITRNRPPTIPITTTSREMTPHKTTNKDSLECLQRRKLQVERLTQTWLFQFLMEHYYPGGAGNSSS